MPDAVPVYLHLLRAKDLIDRDYARDLDVSTLARAAHASPAHFSRSFKRAFGETPHKYMQRRRIERAKELLRETDLMVTAISIEVGFRSLSSFSSVFSELVGESPSDYARRWRVLARTTSIVASSFQHSAPSSLTSRPTIPGQSPVAGSVAIPSGFARRWMRSVTLNQLPELSRIVASRP